eukprot:scaffold40369_cov51-Phaeocystis_antarctica.AAC.7
MSSRATSAATVRSSCSTRACCSERSSSRLCRSLTKYPVIRSSWPRAHRLCSARAAEAFSMHAAAPLASAPAPAPASAPTSASA